MTTEAPAPVRAVVDAANNGDLAGFLACFTDDGVDDDWGREFSGPSHFAFRISGDRVARMTIRA